MDFLKIFITLIVVFNFSFIMHLIIEIWQFMPVKEEKSTPIYITKEIKEN